MDCSDPSDVYVGIWNPTDQMSVCLLIFKPGGYDELALPPQEMFLITSCSE